MNKRWITSAHNGIGTQQPLRYVPAASTLDHAAAGEACVLVVGRKTDEETDVMSSQESFLAKSWELTVRGWTSMPTWAKVTVGLFYIALAAEYWFLVGLALAGRFAYDQGRALWLRRLERQELLRQHADAEHALVMQGDDRGVFGQYPPAA